MWQPSIYCDVCPFGLQIVWPSSSRTLYSCTCVFDDSYIFKLVLAKHHLFVSPSLFALLIFAS